MSVIALLGNESELHEARLTSLRFVHEEHRLTISLEQRHQFQIGGIMFGQGGLIRISFEWASIVEFSGQMTSGLVELRSISLNYEPPRLGAAGSVMRWAFSFTDSSIVISASDAFIQAESLTTGVSSE